MACRLAELGMASDAVHVAAPSAWVLRFADLVPRVGPVLDVACGHGRHARLFASKGYRVVAIDRDRQALAASSRIRGVQTICADLERGAWPFAPHAFAGVVVTNYLHRPLLSSLITALGAGGILIYETFSAGNERYGRPSRPDFLLQPGELLRVATGLRILAFEDRYVEHPAPALVQRVCAINATEVPTAPLRGGFG